VPVIRDGRQVRLGERANDFSWAYLERPLDAVDHRWNEIFRPAERAKQEAYWQLAGVLPVMQPQWKKQAVRLAKRLLELHKCYTTVWLDDPFIMHLSRLCLMLADHHYSSLGFDHEGKPVAARQEFLVKTDHLFANTTVNRQGRRVHNQSLTEHLTGVAKAASAIAYALPGFERYLPRLANHRGLRKRSGSGRFAWQDKAFDAAMSIRDKTREQGAFVINMASTGCGKTLANARILYGLATPQQGMRATYALGLRTLTLQTGRSYRNDLHLADDELAILVGGSASRDLFEYYEARAEESGSASIQTLIEEDCHVLYEGRSLDHPLLSRALANPDIRKLLSAPMLVCTVDHLVPATESQRAGRQIAPMLRLLSSDLILDELDDYDLNDLPALTRLVHWAGLLGTRVVLSSATLAPALVEGMFMAYRAGRYHYLRNRVNGTSQRNQSANVACLWVDEFNVQVGVNVDYDGFAKQHKEFVAHRVKKLEQAAPLRRAEIVPVSIQARQRQQIFDEFAQIVHTNCLKLHHAHSESDPVTGKQVSFGIVRMANIEPLVEVAKVLFAMRAPEDTHIHLCVYHSRFPLVQRSAIENFLDNVFNRRSDKTPAVYELPPIRRALDVTPGRHQLFVVLSSPVCEVGRDWDADWALAEPSSMRALIQLAGRVQRHRRQTPVHPNMLILDAPLKYFTRRAPHTPVYHRPGFEKGHLPGPYRLASPWLHDILEQHEYHVLSAIPRISPRPKDTWRPQDNLVDLEQARMASTMYPRAPQKRISTRRIVMSGLEPDEAAPAWQYPQAMLSGVLPQQQPFRDSVGTRTATLVFLPDEDEENLLLYQVEDDPTLRGQKLYTLINDSKRHDESIEPAIGISPWLNLDLIALLREQAEALDLSLDVCAKKMAVVQVLGSEQGWYWHPWLGFLTMK